MSSSESSSDDIRLNVSQLRKYLGQLRTRKQIELSPSSSYASASSIQRGGGEARDKRSAGRGSRLGSRRSTAETGHTRLSPGLSARGIRSSRDKLSPRLRRLASESLRATSSDDDDIDGDYGRLKLTSALLSKALQQRKALASQANSMASSNAVTRSPEASSPTSQRTRNEQAIDMNIRRRQSSVTSGWNPNVDRPVRRVSLQARFSQPLHDPVEHLVQNVPTSQSIGSTAAAESPPFPSGSGLPGALQPMESHSLVQHIDTSPGSAKWASPQQTPSSRNIPIFHSTASIKRGSIEALNHLAEKHDAPDSPSHDPEEISRRYSIRLPEPNADDVAHRSMEALSAGKGCNNNRSVDIGMQERHRPSVPGAVTARSGAKSADQAHQGQSGLARKALVLDTYVDPAVAPFEDVVPIPCHPSRDSLGGVSRAAVSEGQQSPLMPTGPRAGAKSAAHASYLERQESSNRIGDAASMGSAKAVHAPAVRAQDVQSLGCTDTAGRPQLQRARPNGTGTVFSEQPAASEDPLPSGIVVDRLWDGLADTYGLRQHKWGERIPARRLQTSVEGAVRAVLGVAEKSSDESPPTSPSRPALRPPSREASTGTTAKKQTRFQQLRQNDVPSGMQGPRHALPQRESARESTKHRSLSGSPDRRQAVGAIPAAVPSLLARSRSEGGGYGSNARGLQSQRSLAALALPLMPAPRWRSFTNDDGDSQVPRKVMRSASSSPQRDSPQGVSRTHLSRASEHAVQAAMAGAAVSSGVANFVSRNRQLSSPVAPRRAAASRRVAYDSSSSDGGSAPSLDCTLPNLSLGEARVIGPSTSAANTSASTSALEPALPSFSFPVHDKQLLQSDQCARVSGTGPARQSTDETAQGSTCGVQQLPSSLRGAAAASSPAVVHSPARHFNDTGQVRHAQHYVGIVPPLEIPVTEWSRLRAGPMLAVLSSPASPSSSPSSSPRRQNVAKATASIDDTRYRHSHTRSTERDGGCSSGESKQRQHVITSRSSSSSGAAANNRSRSASPSFRIARPVTAAAAIAAAGAALLKRLSRAPSAAARLGSARATADSGTAAPMVSPPKLPSVGLPAKREASSGGSAAGGGGPACVQSPASPRSLSPCALANVGQQAGSRATNHHVPEPPVGGQRQVTGPQTAYISAKPADAIIAARFTAAVAQRSRERRYVRSPSPVPPVAPAYGSDVAAGSPGNRWGYGESLSGALESAAGLTQHSPLLFPRPDGSCSGENVRQSPASAGSGMVKQLVTSGSRRSGSPQQVLQDAALSPGGWSGSQLGSARGRRYASSPSPSQFCLDALTRSSPKGSRADGFPSSWTSPVPVPMDLSEQMGTSQWVDELLRQVNSSLSGGTSEDGLRLLMSLNSTQSLSPLVRHAFQSGSTTQPDAGAEADAAILRQLADVQRDMEHIMRMTESASAKPSGPSFETLEVDPAIGHLAAHGLTSPSRPSSWSSGTSAAAIAASTSLAQTLAALQRTVRMEAAAANVRSARARASSPQSATAPAAAAAAASALRRTVSPHSINSPKPPEAAGAAAQTGSVSAAGLQTLGAALSKPARKVEPLVLPRVTSPSSPRVQQQVMPRQVSTNLFSEASTAAWSPSVMFYDIGTTSAWEQASREAARRSRSTPRIYGDARQRGRYGSSGDRAASMHGTRISGGGTLGSAGRPRSRSVSAGGQRSPRYPRQHHIPMDLGSFGKLSGGGASSSHGGSSMSPSVLSRHYDQVGMAAAAAGGYTQRQVAHASPVAISGGATGLGLRSLGALDLSEIKRGLSHEATQAQHAGFLSPRIPSNAPSPVSRTPRSSLGAVSTPKASMSAFGDGFPATRFSDTAAVTDMIMGSAVRHDPSATDRTSPRSLSPGGNHAVPKALSPGGVLPALFSSASPMVCLHREDARKVVTAIPSTVPGVSAGTEPIAGATFGWSAASEATPGGVALRGALPLRGGVASGRHQSPPGIRPQSSPANSFSKVQAAAGSVPRAASGATLGSVSPGGSANASKASGGGRTAGFESLSKGRSTGSSAAGATRVGTAAVTAAGAGGARAIAGISPRSHSQTTAMAMAPSRPALSGLPSFVQPPLQGTTTIAAGGATGGRRALSLLTTADVLPYSSEHGARMFSPRHSSDVLSRSATGSTSSFTQAGHRKLLPAAAMVGAGEGPALTGVSEVHLSRVHHPDPSLIRALQLLRSTKASSSSSNAGGGNPGAGGGGSSGTGSSFGGSRSGSCSAVSIVSAIHGAGLSTLHSFGRGNGTRSSSANTSSSARAGRRNGGRRYMGSGQSRDGSVIRTKTTGGIRSPRYYNTSGHACTNSTPLLQRFQQEQRLLPATALVTAGSRQAGNAGARRGSAPSLTSTSLLDQAEDSTGRLTEYSFAPGLEISSGTLIHTPATADSGGSEASGSDSDDSNSQNRVYTKPIVEVNPDITTGATGLVACSGMMDACGSGIVCVGNNGADCRDGDCVAVFGVRSSSPANGLRAMDSLSSSNVEDARDDGETKGQSSSSSRKGLDRGPDGTQDDTSAFSPTAARGLPCALRETDSLTYASPSQQQRSELTITSPAVTSLSGPVVAIERGSSALDMVLVSCDVTILKPGTSPTANNKSPREVQSARCAESGRRPEQTDVRPAATATRHEEFYKVEESPRAQKSTADHPADCRSDFESGELHLPPLELSELQHLDAAMVDLPECVDTAQAISTSTGSYQSARGDSPTASPPRALGISCNLSSHAGGSPHSTFHLLAEQQVRISALPLSTGLIADTRVVGRLGPCASEAQPLALAGPMGWHEADVNQVSVGNSNEYLASEGGRMSPCRSNNNSRCVESDAQIGAQMLTASVAGTNSPPAAGAPATGALLLRAMEFNPTTCPRSEASRDGVCVSASLSSDSSREHFWKWMCTPHPTDAPSRVQELLSLRQQRCHLSPGRPGSHHAPINGSSVPGEIPGVHAKCQGISSESSSCCGVGQSAVATVAPCSHWGNERGSNRSFYNGGDRAERGNGGNSDGGVGEGGVWCGNERGGDMALQKDGDNDGFSTKSSDHGAREVNNGVQAAHPASSDSEYEKSGPMEVRRRPLRAAGSPELDASSGSGGAASSKDGHEYLPLSRVELQDHRQHCEDVEGDGDSSQSSPACRVSPVRPALAPEPPVSTSASKFVFGSRTDTDSLPIGMSPATTGPRSPAGHSASRPQDAAENSEQDPEPEPDISPDLHKRGVLRETATYRRVDLIAADITFSGYPISSSPASTSAAISVAGGSRTAQGKRGEARVGPQGDNPHAFAYSTMTSPAPQQQISQAALVLARELNNCNDTAAVRSLAQPPASSVLARPELVPHLQPAPSRTAAATSAAPTLSNFGVTSLQTRELSGVMPRGVIGVINAVAASIATPVNTSQPSPSIHCSDGPETRGTRLGPMARGPLRYAALQDSSESSPRCWTHGPNVREEETGDSRAESSGQGSTPSSALPSAAPSFEDEGDSGKKGRPLMGARSPERGALHPGIREVDLAVEDGQAAAVAIVTAGVTSKAKAGYTNTEAEVAIRAATTGTSDVLNGPASRSTGPSPPIAASAKNAGATISAPSGLNNSVSTISEIPHVLVAPSTALIATYQSHLDSEPSPARHKAESHSGVEFPPYPGHPRDVQHGSAELNAAQQGYDVDSMQGPPSSTSSQPGPPPIGGAVEQLAVGVKAPSAAHTQGTGSSSQPLHSMVSQSQAEHPHRQPGLASVISSKPEQKQCLQPQPLQQHRPLRQLLLQPQQEVQQGTWTKVTRQQTVAATSHGRPGSMLPHMAAPVAHTHVLPAETLLHVPSCLDKFAAPSAGSIAKPAVATSSAAIFCRPRLSCTLVGPLEPAGEERCRKAPLQDGCERSSCIAGHVPPSYSSRPAQNIGPQGDKREQALKRPPGHGQVSALQHAPAQGLRHPPRPPLEEKPFGGGHSRPNTVQPGLQNRLACSGRLAMAWLGKEDVCHGGKEDPRDCGPLDKQAAMGSAVAQQASVSVHGVLTAQTTAAMATAAQPQKGGFTEAQSQPAAPALMSRPWQAQPVVQRRASSVLVASLRQLNSTTQSMCARMLELYYQEAGTS